MALPPLNTADETALDAIIAVRPVWRSLKRAGAAVNLEANTLLHAGPAFDSPAEITKPIFNSACIAAVIDRLASSLSAAGEAIRNGEIICAVGGSGGTAQEDEDCIRAGIIAGGFSAIP